MGVPSLIKELVLPTGMASWRLGYYGLETALCLPYFPTMSNTVTPMAILTPERSHGHHGYLSLA